ncbi:hypothetical protein K440DRAFT_561107, partial [Wilcoxina mikolae CBS 423.85]
VVAVSQSAINANLYALLQLYPELATVDFKAHDGEMNVKLAAGQVTLPVTENNYSMVYYYATFESGTVILWNDDIGDGGDFGPPIDVSGWIFAFAVNMGKINVEEDEEDHKKITEIINQPGDYSISRLYVDFNSNMSRSSFGSYSMNESEKNSLVSLMLKWATDKMMEPKKSTVGYAVETDSPRETTPYEGLDDKGGNNVLLYLEMTDHKDFPQERLLSYSGNFVSPGMSGTMCIGQDIFWDSFLLRDSLPLLLRVLNESTYGWAKDAWIKYEGVASEWSYKIGVGPGSGTDSEPDFYAWKPEEGNKLSWTWDKSSESKDESGADGSFGSDIRAWCDTNNKMSVTPGSNVINISGETVLRCKVNNFNRAVASMKWNLDVALNSVHEGGLEISLNLPDNPVNSWVQPPYEDNWPFNWHEGEADKLKTYLVDGLNNAPFAQAEEQLQNALRSTARFVVPGGGTFFYKNPIFNDNGDLLIEIGYNG